MNRSLEDIRSAEKVALRLITRAEQSRAGLLRKLRLRGFPQDASTAAIERLEDSGLVDDLRFARLWTASRIIHKSESPRKLMLSLQNRGIEKQIARTAVHQTLSLSVEAQLLEKYLKNRTDKGVPPLRRTLRAEGFSSEAIEVVFKF